jgi:hypothetical protein
MEEACGLVSSVGAPLLARQDVAEAEPAPKRARKRA